MSQALKLKRRSDTIRGESRVVRLFPGAVSLKLGSRRSSPMVDARALEMIAGDPSTPPSVLFLLSHHRNADIVDAVIDNPSTPPAILETLASNPDVDVRYSVAESANMSEALLSHLCQDDNPYVAHRAQRTLASIAGEKQAG